MQNDAVQLVALTLPWFLLDHAARAVVTGLPALADPGRTKVDIFGVVLVLDAWRQQAHDMHERGAGAAGELTHGLAVAHIFRDVAEKLLDHMAQAMRFHLVGNVAGNAARVLDVLLASS